MASLFKQLNGDLVPLSSGADTSGFVKLQSDTTQLIDSDIALDHNSSLLGTDTNNTEHTLISHNEYTGANPGQQTEVGSAQDAICLNWNALGWDGTAQPQGDNPLVNYKDTTGTSKVDWLPLYNKDFEPLLARMASFEMAGVQTINENIPAVGVELDTGKKWIDNKPIYRQVFTGTTSAGNETVDLLTGVVDKLISTDGEFVGSSGAGHPIGTTFPDFTNNSWNGFIVYTETDGDLARESHAAVGSFEYDIVVEYTKV